MSLLASLLTFYETGKSMRHEVIIGVERRCRWGDEEKQAILSEVGVNGASVAQVARAHDITRQHIYQWRQELKRKAALERTNSAGVTFFPLAPPAVEADAIDVSFSAEVQFANGRRFSFPVDICPSKLLRLIQILEAA